MVAFSGVNHVGLTVTDLDRSERFYTDVFDLGRLMDLGYVRVLLHRSTSFTFAIATPEGAEGQPFTELNTGLDHIGFTASSRDELVEWEQRLEALGVMYTPIRDMEFGHHLNFRDPDNIALEISAYNDVAAAWLNDVKEREIPAAEIEARLNEALAALTLERGPSERRG